MNPESPQAKHDGCIHTTVVYTHPSGQACMQATTRYVAQSYVYVSYM